MDKEIREDDNCEETDMARYEIEWMEKQKIIEAQRKIECPNCKGKASVCACMRNICVVCGEPVGNITFSACDICWGRKRKKTLTSNK